MIHYHVLGPLESRAGVKVYAPRGPKIGKVLALLLLRANQVVSVRVLADELWDQCPPRSAVTTIRTHIYHLRKALEAAPMQLITEPTGYRLVLEPGQLDAEVFAQAVDRGRALLGRGDATEAASVLRGALDMWRGPVLANLDPGPVLTRHVEHLEESRIGALELAIEADLQLGRHRRLIAELRGLVVEYPLHEWFYARLIDALHRSGRRGEALQVFLNLRVVLDRELGLEPSADLQRLQHEVLISGARARGGVQAVS